MIKISFLGDIMCEGPFLNAAHEKDGTYDFSTAFSGIGDLLADSDYVIGNLETPLSGEKLGYTNTEDLYSFNSPIEFAQAVKHMGVDLVSTANNHCCDRGIKGLTETLHILDQIGLKHTGTYMSEKDANPFYFKISGITFAVIACTSSTNAEITQVKADLNNVNLLNVQSIAITNHNDRSIKRFKYFIVNDLIGIKKYMKLRKLLGKTPLNPEVDNSINPEQVDKYIDRIIAQICEAKTKADIVFLYPHMGGQFNPVPGYFSEYVIQKFAKTDVDAIICSHPHIIQKFEINNNKPCFFSIGNVSMSMETEYIIRDNLPDYGLIVHFYIDENKIEKVTCSIIKILEDNSGYIRVVSVSDLFKNASEKEKKSLIADINHVEKLLKLNETNKININSRETDLIIYTKGEI